MKNNSFHGKRLAPIMNQGNQENHLKIKVKK